MDIQYSIARGSRIKPTGVMMYSERYTKDQISPPEGVLAGAPANVSLSEFLKKILLYSQYFARPDSNASR